VGSGEGAALRSGSRGAFGLSCPGRDGGDNGGFGGRVERGGVLGRDTVRCGAVRRLAETMRALLAVVEQSSTAWCVGVYD
jgi:hypothetical protein